MLLIPILFFTKVYIRIISLRWKFDDHPLVEYPLTLLFVLYNLETQTSAHETSSDVKLLNKTILFIIFILTKFNHEAVNLDFIYMNSIVVWVKYSNLNAYYLNLPYQI